MRQKPKACVAKDLIDRIDRTALAQQQQADRLADLWNRLSAQHIALGCSCSMSGLSVKLEDFEHDIADYLWAESERWDQAEVEAFLLVPGPIASQDQAVRSLLHRLASGEASQAVADWLLQRLTKTLESYAKLHGPAPEAPLFGGSSAWGKGYRNQAQ